MLKDIIQQQDITHCDEVAFFGDIDKAYSVDYIIQDLLLRDAPIRALMRVPLLKDIIELQNVAYRNEASFLETLTMRYIIQDLLMHDLQPAH